MSRRKLPSIIAGKSDPASLMRPVVSNSQMSNSPGWFDRDSEPTSYCLSTTQ